MTTTYLYLAKANPSATVELHRLTVVHVGKKTIRLHEGDALRARVPQIVNLVDIGPGRLLARTSEEAIATWRDALRLDIQLLGHRLAVAELQAQQAEIPRSWE